MLETSLGLESPFETMPARVCRSQNTGRVPCSRFTHRKSVGVIDQLL